MAKARKRIATHKKSLETPEGKHQACAQEDSKARDAEKAATKDRSKNGTKKSG